MNKELEKAKKELNIAQKKFDTLLKKYDDSIESKIEQDIIEDVKKLVSLRSFKKTIEVPVKIVVDCDFSFYHELGDYADQNQGQCLEGALRITDIVCESNSTLLNVFYAAGVPMGKDEEIYAEDGGEDCFNVNSEAALLKDRYYKIKKQIANKTNKLIAMGINEDKVWKTVQLLIVNEEEREKRLEQLLK